MKILVCDDHALFRQGVSLALRELDDRVEILEAHNGTEALAAARDHEDLDLVLLDLQMPGMDGWTGLARLRAAYPTLPIVILAASEDVRDARRAIDGGAAGYVPKSTPAAVLRHALTLVLAGGLYLPTHGMAPPSGPGADEGTAPEERLAETARRIRALTPKQLEVLRLLARGLRNVEIGAALGISLGTVKSHVASIFLALEVENRTEAALLMHQFELEVRE